MTNERRIERLLINTIIVFIFRNNKTTVEWRPNCYRRQAQKTAYMVVTNTEGSVCIDLALLHFIRWYETTTGQSPVSRQKQNRHKNTKIQKYTLEQRALYTCVDVATVDKTCFDRERPISQQKK